MISGKLRTFKGHDLAFINNIYLVIYSWVIDYSWVIVVNEATGDDYAVVINITLMHEKIK